MSAPGRLRGDIPRLPSELLYYYYYIDGGVTVTPSCEWLALSSATSEVKFISLAHTCA